jgi:hypothetical protein
MTAIVPSKRKTRLLILKETINPARGPKPGEKTGRNNPDWL